MREDQRDDPFKSDGIINMNDSFAANDNYNSFLPQQSGLPAPFPHLQGPGEKSFQPVGG